jgi:hypothetical protein
VHDKDENAQSCSRRGFLGVAASFPAVLMPGGAAGQPQAGAGSTISDSGTLTQTARLEVNVKNGTGRALQQSEGSNKASEAV